MYLCCLFVHHLHVSAGIYNELTHCKMLEWSEFWLDGKHNVLVIGNVTLKVVSLKFTSVNMKCLFMLYMYMNVFIYFQDVLAFILGQRRTEVII